MISTKQDISVHIVIFIGGMFLWLSSAKAQEVEHNYPMGPQYTDCDSLEIDFDMDQSDFEEKLNSTVFRFSQEFRLRRLSGVQYGKFYSCDGQWGYLLVQYNGKKSIHEAVDKSFWDSLVKSQDPDNYYLDTIKKKYPPVWEGIE